MLYLDFKFYGCLYPRFCKYNGKKHLKPFLREKPLFLRCYKIHLLAHLTLYALRVSIIKFLLDT